MTEHHDFDVETQNPQMLDETVQQITAAVVIDGSFDGTKCTVRCFGDPGYLKFAIDQQGYGKVLDS